MLKKFGEEKLNSQLRQHFAAAVASFVGAAESGPQTDPELLLDRFFDELVQKGIDDSESFRVRLFPHRWTNPGNKGAALLLTLYEPELRFQKAILFRARASCNNAVTEEGNLFDSEGIKEEAEELLRVSQSSCFMSFAPQGIHVISASGVLGDSGADGYLLKNFYYLNIADFVANLFFKCFVGDSRPAFVSSLQGGSYCRNLLEIRITGTPHISQRALF